MSQARTELLQFLTEQPGLNDALERKALIDFAGYPHIGIYLDWSGSRVRFAEALIDELSRRGQQFTVAFLESLQGAPQVSVDRKAMLQALRDRIVALPVAAWQQEFPAEPLSAQDRTALVADLDMLAATVVSTLLLPYYELGADEMKAKAGEPAVQTAAKVAARVEETFAANPFAGSMLAMFKQNPQENEAEFLKGVRAMLGQDDALVQDLAAILTAEPAQAEAALQAMVNVSQNIRTVKGDVVGAIVGDDVLRNIGVVQEVDTVESGGTVVGAVIGAPGGSMTIGGQHTYGDTYQAGSQHNEQTIHAERGVVATGGGVAAGGDISGSTIVTGSDNTVTQSSVDTGGGAYVGGNVSTSGGDFVGRDNIHGLDGENIHIDKMVIYQGETTPYGQTGRLGSISPIEEPLIEGTIRLDVAVPKSAILGEPFDLAVAVRQPDAPPISVDDLKHVTSDEGRVFFTEESEVISYRIKIVASGCTVVPETYTLRLHFGKDSPIRFFQITPERPGLRTILINAYQVDDGILVAQTRISVRVEVPVELA